MAERGASGNAVRRWAAPSGAALTAALVGGCAHPSPRAITVRAPTSIAPQPEGHDHRASPSVPDQDAPHHHHGFTDANAWSRVFDDPARDEWQRPADVLRALELQPNMTVADVGAGTGYFAVRLARAVPQGSVIATDLEPDMVRFLSERAAREQLPNLRPLHVTASEPGLPASGVDRILIVDVWHHLSDRAAYARGLAAALRPAGRVLVVDFTSDAQRGPPAELRVPPGVVVAELESAGLSAVLLQAHLPEQYLVEGRRER